MQVIAAPAPIARAHLIALARAGIAAVLLIVVGLLLGYACLATPLVTAIVPKGRPTAPEIAIGVFGLSFAILVPTGMIIIGLARAFSAVEDLLALRPRTVSPLLAKALGEDHLAATGLLLPGGRRIHELVLGPFGIVVLGDLPPASASRHIGSSWEIRSGNGRWVPIEPPLDRAARDAERVRGWLSTDERDFLVKVYAAVVTQDRTLERTPSCAVLTPDELGPWLAALPPQRGLTPGRREQLAELIGSIAGRR